MTFGDQLQYRFLGRPCKCFPTLFAKKKKKSPLHHSQPAPLPISLLTGIKKKLQLPCWLWRTNLYLFGSLLIKRFVSSVCGTYISLGGKGRVIKPASLLRRKQMHPVCNGTVFKKQVKSLGELFQSSLCKCVEIDNGGSQRDLTFQSFWCLWQEADEMCQ